MTPEQLEILQRIYGGGQQAKKLEWHKLSFKGKVKYFLRKCFNTLTQPSDTVMFMLFPAILSLGVFAGYRFAGTPGKQITKEEILQRLLVLVPRIFI